VKVLSRIGLIFGGAFAIDAIVYWITQKNEQGLSLLAMTAAGFIYIGIYTALALRKAGREAAAEAGEEQEPHIGPTIWPAVFALSAVGITLGILVAPWLLIVGGAIFVAAAVGWAMDARRQWRTDEHHQAPAGHGADPGGH
jgi:hypothetical protein